MKPKIPHSPFTTHLSGSAKETELRLRSIFQWKRKRPPVVLIILTALTVLLCCGLVSCQVREEPDTPEDTAQDAPAVSPALPAEVLVKEDTPAQITPVPPEEWRKTAEGAAALDAYRAVLRGEATYFNTFAGEDLTIGQPWSQAGSVTIKVTRFAVLDLDRDGLPEVVLWLNYNGNDYIGFQILRVQDGAVYGYNLVYRAFEELKADGTFSFSSGAFDNGWGTITFAGDSYSVDQVSYCASSYDFDAHQYLSERYVVDHEDASGEEFEAAAGRQFAKPDASWYDFTEDNINAVFSNGESAESRSETFCHDLYTADGRQLKLLLQESRVQADSSCRRVEQIQVYQGDVLLQTIDTASLTYDGDWLYEGLFVNHGYTIGEPDIRDVNFDGSEDFGLLTAATYPKNVPYGYFLWDSETEQFTFSFVICSYLTVDEPRQQLTEQIVGPTGSYDRYNTYEFDADGQLTLVGSEIISR
ncbi:MAG: XAC2610-related protein [Oscillospiraceae bacterium]